MDKIWVLKLIAFAAPGSTPLMLYFDAEDRARAAYANYTDLLKQKHGEQMEVFQVRDLMADYSIRPDFFPGCDLIEVGECDAVWKEIDAAIKRRKEEVGNKPLGFISTKSSEAVTITADDVKALWK